MANRIIRDYAKKKGIPHYLIADELKMQESAFSKLLRKELSLEKREQVLHAIDKLYSQKHSEYCTVKEQMPSRLFDDNSLFEGLLGEIQ